MCRFLLHSSGGTSIATPPTSTNERRTGAIVACQRLSIKKGISAGGAEIKRRAFSRFYNYKIAQITVKATSQRHGDIKNETSVSDLS